MEISQLKLALITVFKYLLFSTDSSLVWYVKRWINYNFAIYMYSESVTTYKNVFYLIFIEWLSKKVSPWRRGPIWELIVSQLINKLSAFNGSWCFIITINLFPSGLSIKLLCTFLIALISAICPTHLILLHLFTSIIISEARKLVRSLSCNFISLPVSSLYFP
jgi:hypothetical protein